jgi:hypothetical protein
MDRYLIKSTLGFNFNVDIRDKEGNVIKPGVKRTILPVVYSERITPRLFDKSFFTSFNEDLLAKIRLHRRLND